MGASALAAGVLSRSGASRRRLLPALGRGARGASPPLRRPRALAGLVVVSCPPFGLPAWPPAVVGRPSGSHSNDYFFRHRYNWGVVPWGALRAGLLWASRVPPCSLISVIIKLGAALVRCISFCAARKNQHNGIQFTFTKHPHRFALLTY